MKTTVSKYLHNSVKDLFTIFIQKNKHDDHYWDIREIAQIKNLVARLRYKADKTEYTDDEIIKRFKYILENLDKQGFIWDGLSIRLIVSQWEAVKTQVRANYRKEIVTIAQKPKPKTNEPRQVQEKVLLLHEAIEANPELKTLFGSWKRK